MCKFIAIVNKKARNIETINKLLRANIESLQAEPDGYSVFTHDKTGFRTQFYPAVNHYDIMQEALTYSGEEVFIIHSRTKTDGASGIDGLHLQPMKTGYFCAHNGTVRGFSGVTDKNDSHYFFEALITEAILAPNGEITPKLVEKMATDLSFTGKAVMYHPKDKTFHFFCQMPAWVSVLPDCLIFSSYELEDEVALYQVKSVLGWTWHEETGTEKIEFLHQDKIDDCYLKLVNGRVIEVEKIHITSSFYGNYGGNYGRGGNYSGSKTDEWLDKHDKWQKKWDKKQKKQDKKHIKQPNLLTDPAYDKKCEVIATKTVDLPAL